MLNIFEFSEVSENVESWLVYANKLVFLLMVHLECFLWIIFLLLDAHALELQSLSLEPVLNYWWQELPFEL